MQGALCIHYSQRLSIALYLVPFLHDIIHQSIIFLFRGRSTETSTAHYRYFCSSKHALQITRTVYTSGASRFANWNMHYPGRYLNEASVKKKAMISIGEMLFAPMVPSCTSLWPIAKIASKKRSAMSGAVTKLMGNLNRMKGLTLPFESSFEPRSEGSDLGGAIRKKASVSETTLQNLRGR